MPAAEVTRVTSEFHLNSSPVGNPKTASAEAFQVAIAVSADHLTSHHDSNVGSNSTVNTIRQRDLARTAPKRTQIKYHGTKNEDLQLSRQMFKAVQESLDGESSAKWQRE